MSDLPNQVKNTSSVGKFKAKNKNFRRKPFPSKPLEETWNPTTKLGRLVKDGHIKSIEEIFQSSLPIKEPEIADFIFKGTLKEATLKTKTVQKQTHAGQRNRYMAIVALGDSNGHISLGIKVGKEAAIAIQKANIQAKQSIFPVRFGYWGNRIGDPHTVPCKVSGKCGSVLIRLIPAPRGTGIVAGPTTRKLLEMAGVEDCFTCSKGSTATVSNVALATIRALQKTYEVLTPDLWPCTKLPKLPFQEHTDVFQPL